MLEQVVTTLASVADTAEEKFINYYDRFVKEYFYVFMELHSSWSHSGKKNWTTFYSREKVREF